MIRTDRRVVAGAAPEAAAACAPEFPEIVTADPHFQRLLALLPRYAASDLPVLLTGEPGTGKELVAEALWALSPRRHRHCQRLNCAGLTASLAGSDLFGHLQGSFTDARTSRPGKFKLAHRGTLFLDEIGELPLSIQPLLLRAVEQGEIEPLGGDAPLKVDVRLVAATNQDLPRLVAQGRFRQDLYDRLAVLTLSLPPLRERGGDVMLLARNFAGDAARRLGRAGPPAFSPGAEEALRGYYWPGNVRELKNTVTRAVLLASGSLIRRGDLGFQLSENSSAPQAAPLRPGPGRLKELLAEEQGNISALARRLQVCTKTIYRWLRSQRLDLTGRRGPGEAAREAPGLPKQSLPSPVEGQAGLRYWVWAPEFGGGALIRRGVPLKFF